MNVNALNSPFSTTLPQTNVPPSMMRTQSPSGINPGQDFSELLRRAENARNAAGTEQSGAAAATQNPSLPRVPSFVEDRELYEAALELETLLVQNMLRGMRNTIQKTNLIDPGFAGEVYEDMLYEEYARVVTRNADFGFAEMAYRELAGLNK